MFWLEENLILSNVLIRGESNFDNKYVEKSIQLVRGSSFRSDFLQNPYFRDRSSILPFKPLTFSLFFSMDGDFLSKQTILSPLKAFKNYEISTKEALIRTYLCF